MKAPLTVDFDRQIFERQVVGGISRHFADLIAALDSDPSLGITPRVSMRATTNSYLHGPGGRPLVRLPDRRGMGRVSALANRTAKSREADLVHHTYYDERWLDRQPAAVRVTTIHDMIPEAMPELFPAGNPHSGKDAYLQASELLVAVSETTRAELLRLRPDVAARVVVIPEAARPIFSPGAPYSGGDAAPWQLLYVGGRGGYKRFDVLLQAIARLRRAPGEVRLLCVGGGTFTASEQALLNRLGLAAEVSQAQMSDVTLAHWYRRATALVVTAVAEGFGLPIVEAMQSGCPVVLPRTSVFPEIAADAGLYYEPGEPSHLADMIACLAEAPELRIELARAGLVRAAAYSWQRTAELMAMAYHLAASSSLVPARRRPA